MCKAKIQENGWEQPRDKLFTRFRLWRILRALGIKRLYQWQRAYVFGKSSKMPEERGSGKTTACLIRCLMW